MKFALITQFNQGFIKGFNAIINGLDYHENTCDVHYIYGGIDENYVEKSQKVFDFGVFPHKLEDLMEKYPAPENRKHTSWIHMLYKYKLASELQDYDAILILDADMMIGANLMAYFKVVAQSDVIIMAHNHLTMSEVENGPKYISANEYSDDHRKVLHANPSWANPKRHKLFYDKIWEYGQECGGDNVAIRKAIYSLGLVNNLLVMPGYFFSNPPFRSVPLSYTQANNKWGFFLMYERLKILHRKWWMNPEEPGEMNNEWKMTSVDKKDICMGNMKNLYKESRRINTEWKLKINWETSKVL